MKVYKNGAKAKRDFKLTAGGEYAYSLLNVKEANTLFAKGRQVFYLNESGHYVLFTKENEVAAYQPTQEALFWVLKEEHTFDGLVSSGTLEEAPGQPQESVNKESKSDKPADVGPVSINIAPNSGQSGLHYVRPVASNMRDSQQSLEEQLEARPARDCKEVSQAIVPAALSTGLALTALLVTKNPSSSFMTAAANLPTATNVGVEMAMLAECRSQTMLPKLAGDDARTPLIGQAGQARGGEPTLSQKLATGTTTVADVVKTGLRVGVPIAAGFFFKTAVAGAAQTFWKVSPQDAEKYGECANAAVQGVSMIATSLIYRRR